MYPSMLYNTLLCAETVIMVTPWTFGITFARK